MHPKYPCAHRIVSASNGAGDGAQLGIQISDFIREVQDARVYDGVHYRNSTEVGTAMRKKIDEMAPAKYLRLLK
jgi:hypothetical protein